MIDRQHGKIVFECDMCPEVLETDTGDWNEAKRHFDAEGWRSTQVDGEWLHGCKKCGKP